MTYVAATGVSRRAHGLWIAQGAALLILAILAGVIVGETPLPLSTVAATFANHLWNAGLNVDPIDAGIIWSYRLPRTLVAAACGAGLALSGVVLQALVRNALADPYLLGVSAGAGAGAVAVTILGVGGGLLGISGGAFIGAALAFAVVAMLARAAGGGSAQLVLAGIAGSQLFNALTSFLIAKSANAEQARGLMFWLLGNLSGVRWPDVVLAAPVTAIGFLICLWFARAMDAFSFGVSSAASLGIAVRQVQVMLIGAVTLMTATMVSLVGSIGFVGLVIPHAMRFVVGPRHARLVPASALAGAVFLILADIASRMLIPGQVVPIGVVTALVGAPGFAMILVRNRRGI
ncbi:iron ABC transporter permease [Sulfitobacter pseudonitzschiae]|uniref:Iron ABC transporter permease n=1 Tax=Pseudosulfitobacter pseudonitzschiae TaxID=1402135 RepID=A0A9Q2P1N6_9RHOB|nr:iron ABC transporter permease [Pseudosulfitobacter pseudonitzschiae]MBM2293056.1 iron ABC transporter permease [Pseudosulfitobacter pseudonitzschiae]MBM2297656.1 iron ABC transporter permease [Pseudosulfitobacter pseudonitzschiae]MBM2302570.1 iron ABC transporter permease [Pseudosulfitobacter pseudonitzschiae]MBM2312440.1 iron ABC transporter permease [Pseudosulfitobacter pseudonitzschiae]MBM2317266.1 iron ABC transporter permease [Pseudosulfitobacter pseudonitzschiae]